MAAIVMEIGLPTTGQEPDKSLVATETPRFGLAGDMPAFLWPGPARIELLLRPSHPGAGPAAYTSSISGETPRSK